MPWIFSKVAEGFEQLSEELFSVLVQPALLIAGRKVRVAHPEFMATAPSWRTLHVYELGDSFEIIDLSLVTAVTVPANGAARKRRGGKAS